MSVREFRNKTSCGVFQDNKQKQNTLVLCLQNCSPQMSHHLIQVPQDFTGKQSKVSYSLHTRVKLKKSTFQPIIEIQAPQIFISQANIMMANNEINK